MVKWLWLHAVKKDEGREREREIRERESEWMRERG